MSGTNATQSDLLGFPEAAEYLRIPKSTLYKKYRTLKIPHLKIGKQVRFPKTLLEKWVIDNCNQN